MGGRVFIMRACGAVRANGCDAPVRYDGMEYWCMKCDSLLDSHPRTPKDGRRWYVLADGDRDEYSEMLRIMEE